jgi:intracellular multiplication protein IcmJ
MRQEPQKPVARQPSLAQAFTDRWAQQPVPGVKRLTWRKDDEHAHVHDKAFEQMRDSVFKRDNYSCRFCAFKSAKYQEVHHFDDNHANNDASNLLTVCNLCHQVFHLGMCGMRSAGFIAAVPELTQVEINHLVRAHFVSQMIGDDAIKDKLTGMYAILRSRADMLKVVFEVELSSPLLLAQVLSACDDATFAERAKLLAPLRVIPTKDAFHESQLAYYSINLRPQFAADQWSALARQLMA